MSAGTAKHPLPPPDQAQPSAKSIRIVVPPTAAPTLAFGEFYSADNEPQDEPQAEQTYYPGNNDCPSHQQFTLHSIITLYDIPPIVCATIPIKAEDTKHTNMFNGKYQPPT